MTKGNGKAHDYGLDLAVIGNGRTAALLEPGSRLVWWCFPRFDSDPIFSRLLAGDEERDFPTSCWRNLATCSRVMCATPPSSRRC
jgi:hypothetical protein